MANPGFRPFQPSDRAASSCLTDYREPPVWSPGFSRSGPPEGGTPNRSDDPDGFMVPMHSKKRKETLHEPHDFRRLERLAPPEAGTPRYQRFQGPSACGKNGRRLPEPTAGALFLQETEVLLGHQIVRVEPKCGFKIGLGLRQSARFETDQPQIAKRFKVVRIEPHHRLEFLIRLLQSILQEVHIPELVVAFIV